jgi:predicted site-specific integrase-resolvase
MDIWHLDPEDLISASEAAEIAGVSEAAVRQWATRGKIHRFPGQRRCDGTMYARPEIEAIAEERQQAATGPHARRVALQAA